jgi:hypothetical protein
MNRRKSQRTTVTVYQASSVELSKRASRNSLSVEVRSGKDLLGTLVMGRGSVQWWPNGNKTNDFKKSWKEFAKLLETAMARR